MEVREVQQRRDAWMSRRKRFTAKALSKFRPLGAVDRVHLDLYPRPHYAYGVLLACMQAKMLGHSATTVIEFGVAGGNGLVALESCAAEIGDALGVEVDVLGFDNGEGMPPSSNPKDMVYWYLPSAFAMDIPKLQSRLTKARLFIGMIEDTVQEATRNLRGPIGFCSFDMDYYSATVAALRIFDAPAETRQPRVTIYADDIFGHHDLNIVCDDVGEDRAFAEFNAAHASQKIQPIRGLRYKRPVAALWNDKMYALHDFAHPDYNTPVNPNEASVATRLNSLKA
ncbi:hypothetical protein EIK56_18210 [Sphingomonas sp. C8-2]|jgi:hypothetical protein|nr:hypothetical protein EIK56_18210 [Sphingomonas sp. C8-2]